MYRSLAQSVLISTWHSAPTANLVQIQLSVSVVFTVVMAVLLIIASIMLLVAGYKFEHSYDEDGRRQYYEDLHENRVFRAALSGGLALTTFFVALYYTFLYWDDVANTNGSGCTQWDVYEDGTTAMQCHWTEADFLSGSHSSGTDVFWVVIAWMSFAAIGTFLIVQLVARPWQYSYYQTREGLTDYYDGRIADLDKYHQKEVKELEKVIRKQDKKLRKLSGTNSPEGEEGTSVEPPTDAASEEPLG